MRSRCSDRREGNKANRIMLRSMFGGRQSTTNDATTQDEFENVEHADAQPMDVTDQAPAPAAVASNENDGSGTAAAAAPGGKKFSLEASVERGEITYKEESSVLGMISIRAPEAPEDAVRSPLDLVVCMDRSGSMRGAKIKLVK